MSTPDTPRIGDRGRDVIERTINRMRLTVQQGTPLDDDICLLQRTLDASGWLWSDTSRITDLRAGGRAALELWPAWALYGAAVAQVRDATSDQFFRQRAAETLAATLCRALGVETLPTLREPPPPNENWQRLWPTMSGPAVDQITGVIDVLRAWTVDEPIGAPLDALWTLLTVDLGLALEDIRWRTVEAP